MGHDVTDGDFATVERRHRRSRRQQLGDWIVESNFPAGDEFRKQRGRHRLGDGADFERRMLVIGALGIRIRTVIGRRDLAVVYHPGRDAGAGAIALETLLECRAHIIVADGKGGRCAERDH